MTQTIIIMEGTDKSGKTTISKALSSRIGIPRFKVQRDNYNWSPEMNLKYLTEGITQFLEQSGSSIILDRWHPSDFVYDRLFKRQSDDIKIMDIDGRLAKLDALLVVCYKTPEHYEVDLEDADFVNPSMYDEMNDLYKEFISKTKCKVLHLNTSDRDIEEQLSKIIKLCSKA
jgi:thymidylate kinase